MNANRGRPRCQEERTRSIIYHMTQEDVGVVPDVVAGTLQLGLMQVYDLFDHRANHSFVACTLPSRLSVRVTIGTPLGENINELH